MPRARRHVRRAAAGQRRAPRQGDRRDQGAGDLHGRLPAHDRNGTFIINGAERVVVSQLVRSPGVYFTLETDPTTRPRPRLRQADPQPRRLAGVRDLQQGRHLRQGRPQAQDPGHHPAARHRQGGGHAGRRSLARTSASSRSSRTWTPTRTTATSRRRSTRTPAREQGRGAAGVLPAPAPGRPADARERPQLVNSLFFNPRRYDLGKVGRYKVNKRLEAAPHAPRSAS